MSKQETGKIRNFCIIAHIDHGKSTLSDRLLELTGTLRHEEVREQTLDTMELERERGITIKMHPVRMEWKGYILNLIDTPGHVDFSYEVSRSLAACEGAVLLVDASEGVRAQTVSNLYLAAEQGLEIVPVLNKTDLPGADPQRVTAQLSELMGEVEPLLISAKEGTGVAALLDAVTERVPAPQGDPEAPLRALVFDAEYEDYRGVLPYIRVVDGSVAAKEQIEFAGTGRRYEVTEVGVFTPEKRAVERLSAGEAGYIAASISDITEARAGDTVRGAKSQAASLPGYREPKPMVYAGFYPVLTGEAEGLDRALARLKLADAALTYIGERSPALGPGFRCGFLGMLHLEIVKERLLREFNLEVIVTSPTIRVRVKSGGKTKELSSAGDFPDVFDAAYEPYARVEVVVPEQYVGNVLTLLNGRRGEQLSFKWLGAGTALLEYLLPLSEVIFDLFDRLKSISRGYASLDYEFDQWRQSDIVRLDILLSGERVDALSSVVHREEAQRLGRATARKLRKLIPRQLFEVVIQAALGKRVIAKERVAPLRKDVTAKCYGGDITRKRKLLEKQKEGKKRMKKLGRVEVPKEAFLGVLGREAE